MNKFQINVDLTHVLFSQVHESECDCECHMGKQVKHMSPCCLNIDFFSPDGFFILWDRLKKLQLRDEFLINTPYEWKQLLDQRDKFPFLVNDFLQKDVHEWQ